MKTQYEIEGALKTSPFKTFLDKLDLGKINGQSHKAAKKALEWVLENGS